ncbi:hypothetical protein [Tolypothrix sp. VBCCA 56010]|uniref:hypothetical protein n=1 Tax=Tolypothrix sp. VBCCA 56010 TaxID=3137731 RepID=UPI003D7DC2B8
MFTTLQLTINPSPVGDAARTGSPVASSRQSRRQVRVCRETLSAVTHGGNPQDRAASPTHCLPNALAHH